MPTTSTHRLRRGLPGYLILFAPHAFAPQRQYRASESPSPLVFRRISTNFTSTLGIPPAKFDNEPCNDRPTANPAAPKIATNEEVSIPSFEITVTNKRMQSVQKIRFPIRFFSENDD